MKQTMIDWDTFFVRMPKVELHVHLEGSIPIDALWTLVKKYDGRAQVSTIRELQEKFHFIDFSHFLDIWAWKNQFLRAYEDFEFIATSVAGHFIQQNIRYAELFFSPGDFVKYGLDPREIASSIRKGLNRFSISITVNLIVDLVRDFGPEQGNNWLEQMAEVKDCGVIGIGIGGSESEFPPHSYKKVFERARELGFKTTAHAGEAAGAGSIWGAITELKVDRIGHGVRAAEDPQLVNYIIEHQIPVEMCPLSNVKTGVISNLRAHPIKQFFNYGMLVSVNTDDPAMFNTSLENEYMSLFKVFNFHADEMRQLVLNGVTSAWCNQHEKEILSEEINKYFSTYAFP